MKKKSFPLFVSISAQTKFLNSFISPLNNLLQMKKTLFSVLFLCFSFYSQAQINKAVHFTGANDKNDNFMEIQHNNSLNLTSATFEVWVNWEGTANIGNLFMKTGNQSIENYGWGLGINKNGQVEWWQQYLQGTGPKSTSNPIQVNTWTHIAVTVVHNGDIKFYINGLLSGTNKAMIMNGEGSLIVAKQGIHNNYFNGKMDELRIWNVALTQKQIKANMNKELQGNEKNLVLYCNFNNVSLPTPAYEGDKYMTYVNSSIKEVKGFGVLNGDGMLADSNPTIIQKK